MTSPPLWRHSLMTSFPYVVIYLWRHLPITVFSYDVIYLWFHLPMTSLNVVYLYAIYLWRHSMTSFNLPMTLFTYDVIGKCCHNLKNDRNYVKITLFKHINMRVLDLYLFATCILKIYIRVANTLFMTSFFYDVIVPRTPLVPRTRCTTNQTTMPTLSMYPYISQCPKRQQKNALAVGDFPLSM